MVVCTYFQQGRCKFGDRCKNEHPRSQQTFTGGNRFGALSAGGGFNSRGFSGQNQQSKQEPANYGITTADIKADLTAGEGRPIWVFSCYGPGKNAPRQLFGGPQREQSFEELRLRHYEAAAAGNPGPAIQEAENMYNEAVNQMEVVLRNLNAALKYVVDGANEHPNRIDIIKGDTGSGVGQTSAFGQSSTPAFQGSGFTQQAPSRPAFGQPSFGQPSLGQPSGFGQPSFGQPSGFGQPSALGASSGFGKPAFGQPSQPSFGKPSLGQSGFGQPSTLGGSGFGQASDTASPFSQISATPASGFGNASPFAQAGSGFANSSTAPATTGGFGVPSQPNNPFSQPSAPFGQPVQPTNPSPFGTTTQQPAAAPSSAFGQPAGGSIQISQPASSGPVGAGPPPFIRIENPNELAPIPPLSGPTTHNPMTKKLQTWKGQPVQYIDDVPCYLHPQDRKTYVRIFFPDGPPDAASLRDAQAEPDQYTPEVTEQYEFFIKNGYFKDGLIPRVPPKTEWVSFDF
ncbi:hypothetical protein AN4595.2 [Aspergillus nidulans FGSC A4]|uniref:An-Nup2 Nuclear pore complex protein (Eurofung) n=1 Tax=Emericella nidulans (strain FGSC A4 / ATCC 38163 / CBS 112.46 / NRRL 194 / M139) TaxID=227321 RepID=Q5B4D5_EMENI|nr:FG-nucleoporin NUP42 [Aspergillus nidulans FGSC A4]EAA60397.1 hypothetical protein AN4595.2 [Aspergillus nidulans FGSC A4]CBF77183.1 TPA: An-Nup2 Nuclear pore complex protein (Eurofung) [Aspergillus nidulans FGSC A4]|eukprot:XP_662199.1 hypothetical protein AN4595.2 [Aspergillus nidulans FGSC A4]